MNLKKVLKEGPLYSAIILESYFSEAKRRLIINITKYLILLIPIIIILTVIFSDYGINNSRQAADVLLEKTLGLILFLIGIYILMHIFEAYFASIYYFEYVGQNKYKPEDKYTFSAGRILRRAENDNILTGLLRSQSVGQMIMLRLGIKKEEIKNLLEKQKGIKQPPVFSAQNIPLVRVIDIINFVYNNHPDFKNLLVAHGLEQKDLEETTKWVIFNIENREYERKWWSREKLAKIPGVATDWSFGKTYLLNKYSRNIMTDKEVSSPAINFPNRNRELGQLQAILSRQMGANAILVGAPGQEKMEVIWSLVRTIKEKRSSPTLTNRQPRLLLTNALCSSIFDRNDFEQKITTILGEALNAGNIILIIDNLPKLILQARQYGLNFCEMIEPYLVSNDDQIIALADTEYFHTIIETDQAIMSQFETVNIKPLLPDEITKIISHEAMEIENKFEIFYTYPAIQEIAKSAEYYFPDGVSSDKAKDLLNEISPWAVANGTETVCKEDILNYVSKKTNIPVSAISLDEKNKLLNLENLLMKRIVAQREAVFAIAGAIRRNRAGIRNEKRPMGSFLFIGPTGVGKTETAKALADVMFGSEKLLLRLDMSEYQNKESLARLIGSQENNTQGILSNMLRENPYGILLLDEFEKTNTDILNLFLQIIDEGYFSDVFGKKVMARNIMFIATSNAGSEKIFDLISSGKNIKNHESEIVSDIIKQGIFRPELINRFDATILFHPLTKENLYDIADLMIKKVTKKLAQKGIVLSVDKDLIDFIVTGGYNQTFGARPMNRLIQDTVEQHLADLIIREELSAGKKISFKIISTENSKNSLVPLIK